MLLSLLYLCKKNGDGSDFLLCIRMTGNEGFDLLREALDAIAGGHTQMAGLCIVGLHLRILGNRSLLRARKAQEGDYEG